MSKVENTSRVSLELTTRMNIGRRGARAKLSILDIVHKLLCSLERVDYKRKVTKWMLFVPLKIKINKNPSSNVELLRMNKYKLVGLLFTVSTGSTTSGTSLAE